MIKKGEDDYLEKWILWLQVRIPEMKKLSNEQWLRVALDGYYKGKLSNYKSTGL